MAFVFGDIIFLKILEILPVYCQDFLEKIMFSNKSNDFIKKFIFFVMKNIPKIFLLNNKKNIFYKIIYIKRY